MRLTGQGGIRIAARHSDLARLQAYRVGQALQSKFPGLKVDYQFRASLGDTNLNDPLWKMPEKGVFTEDFLKDLVNGDADLVVHSWKDLPTETRPNTEIVATLPRADLRDLLLFRKDRMSSRSQGRVRILTSSPRRSHNLGAFLRTHLPFEVRDVEFESVRGNIPTRLKKLISQDVDGLIVAKAALDRLLEASEPEFEPVQREIRDVLSQVRFMVLPLSVNPTAAAQGALAVEIARTRTDLREMLASINCPKTFAAVEKERKILASYGGGCHQKIGVSIFERHYGEVTFLRGLTDRGQVLDSVSLQRQAVVPPRAESDDAIFPRRGEEAVFFDRRRLSREQWAWAEKEKYLWVARETAWPEELQARDQAIVWAAGLRTWQRLAERGVWVSGSAEGLGEEESMRLETLLGETTLNWVKLTHSGSHAGSMRACATYELRPKASATREKIENRSHFYWMSGSSFDRAMEIFPELRAKHHACGPGLTFHHLRARLGPDHPVTVYLSPEDWRRDVLGPQH